MAEKEERIYIDVENDNLDRLKHLSMTRQEAISKMAKVRYAQSPCYDALGNEVSFEDFREYYEPCYEDLIKEVEPLLNALLEGK